MLQGNGSGASGDDAVRAASSQASTAAQADVAAPSKLAAWKSVWPGSSAEETPAAAEDTYIARERSLAEAVLPVQMSCRQAFDMAWACQSPAGQWRAVYRHGGVRPCSELWDDFWFCMRVKGYGEGPLKEEAIREHYRKKEMDKYYKPDTPSSEDIWQSRTVDEVLAPGTVFQNSFKAVLKRAEAPVEMTAATTSAKVDDGREDANQILADAERRRRIRQQMGYTT
ncbi:hypothetical protein F503_06467 [Ophiostoma piceae UAMH 11346]|uniref:Early meiotic induction protein 1 n=1 Tax=Ophiostoma piceae (strain UAMH 11346) TaxID=1262450 RepID=S3BWI5_OPHP1|nr:hypothetical protein F503_06467 [Ophiostoma piceae UAMH 11346]